MNATGWKTIYRRPLRRALRQTLTGRRKDPGRPEKGRFLAGEADEVFDATWRDLREIVAEGDLSRYPTAGSRHNVFLAMVTVAGYHALLERGIARDHAFDLLADVGWKLYALGATQLKRVAKVRTRDPQRRMNLVLRMLIRFPFNSSSPPGYVVEAGEEPEAFFTTWTSCAPLNWVRLYGERHGDGGELEALRRSWCSYDWALAHLLVDGGDGRAGSYERPDTLSSGDASCPMRWSALPVMPVRAADSAPSASAPSV